MNKNLHHLSHLLFLGSLFLTSEKFVNETNTPKYYFVVTAILITILLSAISCKQFAFGKARGKTMLWGISIVCFLQACYGLLQLARLHPSNYSNFAITGSFDNPAGFAAVLSMGFPIGLFLLVKSKSVERYLVAVSLVVIAIAVFLSGSRTGIFAIISSAMVFLFFGTDIISKFAQLKYYKSLSIFILTCLISISAFLYYQKNDSANGRMLVWKVSTEMIKDKPVFGHGFGMFQAKNMDYQAEYFKSNPNSKFKLLADNVKHPFNEFIKVAVEFGIIGLAAVLLLLLFILWKTVKSKNEYRGLILSGLVSFLVLSCFSYPLQYISTWVLLVFYLAMLLPRKEIVVRNTFIAILSRSTIAIACLASLLFVYQQISSEIKWKAIAMNSLQGNTKEMLPEYEKLYSTSFKRNPLFLYNYGAELNVDGEFESKHSVNSVMGFR